ncbi:MAG: Wzz/FepE/Etk N-terminal domain-containing protein, partial [Xanthobacteraceae bacterium]
MFETPRQIRTAVVGDGNFTVAPAPLAQIDFSKIGSVLWRGRTTIVLCMLAALALAVVYVALAPREYTAVTQIL